MGLPDNESHRRGNHGRPKSGIPKRKKTSTHTRLSCKIEYLPRPNQPDRSSASEFFTDDHLTSQINEGDSALIERHVQNQADNPNATRESSGQQKLKSSVLLCLVKEIHPRAKGFR